jgi:hypothetical protein
MSERAQNVGSKEERRYFRIEDLVGVSYRVLSDAEYH